MGLIDLIKYKPLYNIFVLLSLGLYFNENIQYSEIKKFWITIKNNKLIWNHKNAELRHVLNNIVLVRKQVEMPPRTFQYNTLLSNLLYENCTKYEKFTSEIVNDIASKNTNIKNMRIMHCKNIRGDSIEDLPLMSLQIIDKTEKQNVYTLSESIELTDLMNIFLNFNKDTLVVCFTDWRALYRKGYSLSHAHFFFINEFIKNIINNLNVIIMSVVMTKERMYAIDMVN